MSELKHQEIKVIQVLSKDFDSFVKKHYGLSEFSFVADQLSHDNSVHSFGSFEKEELDSYEQEKIDALKNGNIEGYITPTIIQDITHTIIQDFVNKTVLPEKIDIQISVH